MTDFIIWIITFLTGVITIIKAIHELVRSRIDKAKEFRWQQAKTANAILDEIWRDKQVFTAFLMLDYNNRTFYECACHEKIKRGPINHEQMLKALRIDHDSLKFTDDEVFIRDCFDSLFDGLSRCEHFLNIGFILPEDVLARWDYYIHLIARDKEIFEKFATEYGYSAALAFFQRFACWKRISNSSFEQFVLSIKEKPSTRINDYWLSEISYLAYDNKISPKNYVHEETDLICEAKFNDIETDTQVMVISNSKNFIIVFRGTEPTNLNDWLTDIKVTLVDNKYAEKNFGRVGSVEISAKPN